ncbi:MAG: hypothetical protein R3E87_04765 [Burkholderiaceae bacterium]
MQPDAAIVGRRAFLRVTATTALGSTAAPGAAETLDELIIDHVMFPVYMNDPFLEVVEQAWKSAGHRAVFAGPRNPAFKGVYLHSRSFYVETVSNVREQPYWSNALYFVVPTEFWDHYREPALRTEHFLVPAFGCGFQLVSPRFPYLNEKLTREAEYDGLTILISPALAREVTGIAGRRWRLPASGKLRVHDGLHHPHDIVVIDDQRRLVAPLFQCNPLLREFL